MIAKALELRDENTFIAILCVDMNPHKPHYATYGVDQFNPNPDGSDYHIMNYVDGLLDAQRYLLRRCGYACDGRPNIIMTRLDGSGKATNDPYAWGGRTYPVAHDWIIDHWHELKDGDVVDVQFILGETSAPKRSERDD